jgi:ubiquinone biosynthesis protein UbiJ
MNPLLIVALSAPVETLINAVIAQDVGSQRRLAALEGKSVQLQCSKPVAFSLYMQVLNARLALRAIQEEPPSAGIKADAGALLRLLLGGGQSGALFSPDVQLSGDTHVVQALHGILGGLNIDWEAHLARLFGDVLTRQVSTAVTGAREWSAQTGESLRADLDEYVHEEARVLPSRAETRIFAERLDELKLALDRIQARAAHLRQNVAEQAPHL